MGDTRTSHFGRSASHNADLGAGAKTGGRLLKYRYGARSAAGSMTALSPARSVRER